MRIPSSTYKLVCVADAESQRRRKKRVNRFNPNVKSVLLLSMDSFCAEYQEFIGLDDVKQHHNISMCIYTFNYHHIYCLQMNTSPCILYTAGYIWYAVSKAFQNLYQIRAMCFLPFVFHSALKDYTLFHSLARKCHIATYSIASQMLPWTWFRLFSLYFSFDTMRHFDNV